MKLSNTWTLPLASLCLGGVLGLVIVGGSSVGDEDEVEDTSRHRQSTRRVIPAKDGLGISSFLARNARRESLPLGYLDKRKVMRERKTSPFRLQAVLYHHMDNLTNSEVMALVENSELMTDREVKIAFGQLAKEDPSGAVDLALKYSRNIHQRLLAVRMVYGTWAQEDPKGMFDYIARMDTGGQRMIHHWHTHLAWLNNDPAGMTKNYSLFPKRDQHYYARKSIRTWLRKDEQAARRYVSGLEDLKKKQMFEAIIGVAE